MSFNTDFLTTATLIKITLPGVTLRFCDGGFVVYQGELYESEHSDFGTLATGEAISEGEGDEAPGASITFIPNSNAAAQTLSNPAMQYSPIEISQVAIDSLTGTILQSESLFEGFIDIPTFRPGGDGNFLDMDLIGDSERFFMVHEGNRMSQENHQRRWSGEAGHNNMSGVEKDVAWGTESRPRSYGSVTTGTLVNGRF